MLEAGGRKGPLSMPRAIALWDARRRNGWISTIRRLHGQNSGTCRTFMLSLSTMPAAHLRPKAFSSPSIMRLP